MMKLLKLHFTAVAAIIMLLTVSCSKSPYDKAMDYLHDLSNEVTSATDMELYDAVYGGDRVCVENFVNYINDDLERSMLDCAIKKVSDANIFSAVNPNSFSYPYKVLLDNLPPGCKHYWVGDLVRVNDLNSECIEFGVDLEI